MSGLHDRPPSDAKVWVGFFTLCDGRLEQSGEFSLNSIAMVSGYGSDMLRVRLGLALGFDFSSG